MACGFAQTASAAEVTHKVTTVVRADHKSGRLVRRVLVDPKIKLPRPANQPSVGVSASGPSADLSRIVDEKARSYDVDPLLVHSVIQVESNYDPYALSPKGAEGLMQLIPSTARWLGVRNTFDPVDNIDGGVRYLKYLQSIFGDDRLALAAYNAGEGAVARYGWIPPYPETQNYVTQVSQKYGDAKRAAAEASVGKVPSAANPELSPADEHPKLEQYQDEQGRICFRTR